MAVLKTIRVPLKGRSYPVYIGDGILARLPELLARHCAESARPLARRSANRPAGLPVVLVTDEYLRGRLAAEAARRLRRAGWEVFVMALPRGEKAKSFAVLQELYGFLLRSGANRRTPLVALGGGTVGDAAGFAAATYYRGIPLVQVSTTLLAQVDSSIGGKTGVNHPLAKNAVGAFHQPAFVLADVGVLKTLSRRELLSGLGEAVKCGLASDAGFARWLDRSWDDVLRRKPGAMLRLVRACAAWKARIVAEDEFDLKGSREFLNFGHTLGHALEAATGYRWFLHGEAVAWGLRAAVALSEGRGWLENGERRLAASLLAKLPAPEPPKGLRWSAVAGAMRLDKKVRSSKNVFVLLRRLGRPVRVDDVTPSELERAAGRIGLSLGGTIERRKSGGGIP